MIALTRLFMVKSGVEVALKNESIKQNDIDRPERHQMFWRKVNVLGPNDCWEWNASLRTGGYGHMMWNGISMGAHRISYLLSGGTLVKGMEIDHICQNRKCVNPNHLRQCTKSQNLAHCKLYKTNTTGYKGVTRKDKKFVARINDNGRTIYLGDFTTAEEAYNAFCVAARRIQGEFASPRSLYAGKSVPERVGIREEEGSR